MPEIFEKARPSKNNFSTLRTSKLESPCRTTKKGEKPKFLAYRFYGILFVTQPQEACKISSGVPTGRP
ncbi:MAG: hypothetical protein ACLR8J_08415 [Sutterella wadsworthensis]